MNAKGRRTRSLYSLMVNIYFKRCECKCTVILLNLASKVCIVIQVLKSTWPPLYEWKPNLPLQTAESKAWIPCRRIAELFCHKMQCSAVVTLYIHVTKRMWFHWLSIGSASLRQAKLGWVGLIRTWVWISTSTSISTSIRWVLRRPL